MIHRKLPGLMSDAEVIARTASRAMETAESSRTSPSGSVSIPNADGSRTIYGIVNGTDATGTAVSKATYVGDTAAPGAPIGVTAASSAGVIVAFWSGSLTGGVPSDFDHVTIYAALADGTQKMTLGTLVGEGSVTSASLTQGTSYVVYATAEDCACLEDGTPSHNVSHESARVTVTVDENVDPQALADAKAAAEKAADDAAAAKQTAEAAQTTANSAQTTANAAQTAASNATTSASNALAAATTPTYRIVLNAATVSQDPSGACLPTTLSCKSWKDTPSTSGSTTSVAYAGRMVIDGSVDGSSWTRLYTPSANASTVSKTLASMVTALDSLAFIRVTLYLAGGTTTQLAQTIINVVQATGSYLVKDSTGVWVTQTPDSVTGPNTGMTSDHFAVRNGTTELMTASKDTIELGKNSTSSIIKFNGGKSEMAVIKGYSYLNANLGVNYSSTGGVTLGGTYTDSNGNKIQTDLGIGITFDGASKSTARISANSVEVYGGKSIAGQVPFCGTVLFYNESVALNVSITLSFSAADYSMLRIYFKTDDGCYSSFDVWDPNGKHVTATTNVMNPQNGMYIKSKTFYINGTSISTHNSSGWWTGICGVSLSKSVSMCQVGDYIGITRVEGYR